jgi:uncharacterized membrane protein YozB (DUF420 family)
MNLYLEPPGFLGTGASLLADLTLLAYLLLIIPAMVGGAILARRGLHRPHHKWLMIWVTAINWVLILVLMIVAYNFDVIDNITAQPVNPRYLLPTIHGLLGIPAQLLATYIVYRMLREDAQVARAKARGERNLKQYWYLSAKPAMRISLALWLLTAAFGIASYVIRYNVVAFAAGDATAPVATPEVSVEAPAATAEVLAPAVTSEAIAPVTTPEISDDQDDDDDSPILTPEPPAATPEAPVRTEEADDDDDN